MEKTQEELILENRVFIKEAFEKMGFGTAFNLAFDKGAAKGQEKIDFPNPGVLVFDSKKNERVEYMPEVVLNPDPERESQYRFKGYMATRYADGEDPRSHYFHVFKKTGLHAEKAHAKLNGQTVLEMVIDDNKQLRSRYSKLLLDEPKTPTDNYKTANVWAKDRFEIVKILNLMPLAMRQSDSDDIANKLQFGEKVSTTMRGQTPMKVELELAINKGSRDVVIRMTNEAGQSKDYSFKQERTMKLVNGESKSQKQDESPSGKGMQIKGNKSEAKKTTKTSTKIAEGVRKLVNKSAAKKTAKAKVKRA